MNEVWKLIPGYSGYEVSNLGNVRSYRKIGVLDTYVEKSHRLSPGVNRVARRYFPETGYRFVLLRKDGKSYNCRIHQLVLEAFVGPRPVGYQAAHLNGNSLDNRLENLKWVTPKENMAHKKLHGTNVYPKGEDNAMAKLTEAQAIEIKTRLNARESTSSIAADYPSVDEGAIKAIHRNLAWQHVGPEVTYNPCWRHLTPDQTAEIVTRVQAGQTVKHIGTDLGIDYSTVSRAFKRVMGISIREYMKVAA